MSPNAKFLTPASGWSWSKGIPDELAYWNKWLTGKKGAEGAADLAARYNPDHPFHPAVEAAITLPAGSLVRVLDVGAGPISSLGYRSAKYDIRLIPIDALADDYRKLIGEVGLKVSPVPTIQCKVEDIAPRFGRGSFEVAHARNSLDHCPDPLSAIRNMADALVPGGLLYIRTHDDEGMRRKYAGFHGWNFHVRDRNLFLWRPDVRHNISEMFPGSRIADDASEIVFTWTKDRAKCST